MRSVSLGIPASQRSHRGRVSPCAGKAQVTAGKDLYVSESTDLVGTGAQDAAGSNEAPAASGTTGRSRRRGSGLTGMLLPELQQLAAELGISGTARMRKGDLVAAISARQVGGESANGSVPAPATSTEGGLNGHTGGAPAQAEPLEAPVSGGANSGPVVTETESAPTSRRRRGASRPAGSPAAGDATAAPADSAPAQTETSAPEAPESSAPTEERTDGERPRSRDRQRNRDGRDGESRGDGEGRPRNRDGGDRPGNRNDNRSDNRSDNRGDNRDGNRGPDRAERTDRGARPDNRDGARPDSNRADGNRNDRDEDDDDFEGGRGRRGRRYRDRNRRGGGRERFEQGEPTINDDDVLLPVAGILDVLDNYAFVRTSGYLTGPNDVYVSLSQVRRYGLRRGDAITGAVRQPRDGERKDKYNALVRLDTVNQLEPDQAKNRPELTQR